MTNNELLNTFQPFLQTLSGNPPKHVQTDYEGAQTTPVKYAIIKNQRRLQDSLEDYQEALSEIADEHDVDLREDKINDEDFEEELQELLEQDSGFDPYTITENDLKQEPNIPLQLIAMAEQYLVEEE